LLWSEALLAVVSASLAVSLNLSGGSLFPSWSSPPVSSVFFCSCPSSRAFFASAVFFSTGGNSSGAPPTCFVALLLLSRGGVSTDELDVFGDDVDEELETEPDCSMFMFMGLSRTMG
jgi:hypothetical protein